MKIKVMIDSVSYKSKPTKEEIAKIQIRLRQESAIKVLTIEELFHYIGKGYTFVPAITVGGAKNENWREQQLICIDVDNDTEKVILPEEAIRMFENKNISVLGYYHTFSSTKEKPRYRLLFLLPEPCTEWNKVEFIIKTLIDFINGDQSCKNSARLFYGTDAQKKEVTVVNANATITLDDVIKIYKPSPINDYNKNGGLMQMISDFDFESYLKQENDVDHTSGNITYFKSCSICGHKDCLRYYHDTNSFFCFGSNGNKGGTIIDYLIATKNMDKADAIKYFKNELMKLSEENQEEKEDILIVIEEKIKSHIKELGYPVPLDIDWIECYCDQRGNFRWIVNCPRVVKYISDNVPYVYAKNKSKSGTVKYFYIDNKYKALDDDEIRGFIKNFIEPLDAHKMKYLNEILSLLTTELKHQLPLEQMNSNEDIINFKNGILNLKTGELEPHSPKYLTTIQLPCDYEKNCPVPDNSYFDNYINDLTNGNDEVKKLLLQGIGVAISNLHGYRMKQAFFCVGPGNSGKTQIKLLLTKLLGEENCSSVDLKDMEKPFHSIELLNARLAGSNDMSGLKISNLDKFKQLTGGDYITDSYKNEGLIDFRFNGLLWMLGNRMPVFGGDKGDHVYNRMIIIECNNVIPEEKRDKFLLEHLLEEKEYIIAQGIKGLQEVIANGYKYDIPEQCMEVNKLYRVENDSFLSFLEECIIDRDKKEPIKDKCTVKVIYNAYKEWCKINNGGYCQSKKEMKKMLNDLGKGDIIHTNGGFDYFKDITLSIGAKMDYCEEYKNYTADDPAQIEILQEGFNFLQEENKSVTDTEKQPATEEKSTMEEKSTSEEYYLNW